VECLSEEVLSAVFTGPAGGLLGGVKKADHFKKLARANGYSFLEFFEAMDRARRTPAAFHLPEVCRQICAEAATLAYKLNTFKLRSYDREWIDGILPAQRDAITAIEPPVTIAEAYVTPPFSNTDMFTGKS
jgi:hypothetical protein